MEQTIYNEKYKSWDAMTRITSQEAIDAFDKGYVPHFVSPGIFGKKLRYEERDGKLIKVFVDWEGVHSAIVMKPSFRPQSMATIQDTACTGNKVLCRKELENIAVAEEIDIGKLLENNFASLNITSEKINSDKKMPDDKTGVNDSFANNLVAKLEAQLAEANEKAKVESEKSKTYADSLQKEQEKVKTLTSERDTYKTKTESFETEKNKATLRKQFDEKLKKTKIFHKDDEARNAKVEYLVENNFKPEAVDTMYKEFMMTDEEIKEEEEKAKELSETENKDSKIGIAEEKFTGLPTKKANQKHIEGAKIMGAILEARVF